MRSESSLKAFPCGLTGPASVAPASSATACLSAAASAIRMSSDSVSASASPSVSWRKKRFRNALDNGATPEGRVSRRAFL